MADDRQPPAGACDLLVENGLVITVDEERRMIERGAVAIAGGRIVAGGPTEEGRAAFAAERVIDAAGKVVTPGLMNAHLHTTQGLYRGYVPDDVSDTYEYIFGWVVPYYVALTPEEERLAVALSCADSLRQGVTNVAEAGTMRHPLSSAEAIAESGIRGFVGRWIWDLEQDPPQLRMTERAALDAVEEVLDAFRGGVRDRVRAFASVIGMATCSEAVLTGTKVLADRYGAVMQIHQSLDAEEVARYQRHAGFTGDPMTRFAQLGLLGPDLRMIHMLDLDAEGVELVAQSGASIVRCLGAYAGRGVAEMRAQGIPVAFGTDTVNLSNSCDMLRAIHHSVALAREWPEQFGSLTVEAALEMLTLDGARSVGAAEVLGSLSVDKEADLVIFDAGRPEWVPQLDPVGNLMFSADGGSAETVIVGGDVLVEGGRLTRVDEAALYAEAQEAAERIVARLGIERPRRWPLIEGSRA
ncbi:MAG: amidohydrolase family protein [Conexibacter sp.]